MESQAPPIPTLCFTSEPMSVILTTLEAILVTQPPGAEVQLTVVDPDVAQDRYSGEPVQIQGTPCVYRDYQTWLDLAAVLSCALCTPKPAATGFIRLRLRKLAPAGWHERAAPSGHQEKYGADTEYSRIHKPEEPSFLAGLRQGLRFLRPPTGARILAVGANQGDELEAVDTLLRAAGTPPATLLGIDHSASAVQAGNRRGRHPLIQADLRAPLSVGRFDLITAINVLHSPSLDGQAILGRLIREHTLPGAGLIIGLPASRYVDRRLRFGVWPRPQHGPELSVLFKVANHYRRLLIRRGFQVRLSGQHTLFITARQPTG